MTDPFGLIARHGLALVAANVLVERLGIPVPAVPTLVVAGALAAEGRMSLAAVSVASLVACAVGDGLWYVAGRRFGIGILRLLCRMSLSPDSCVRQTENQFERWGALGLVFGKFVPGVATLAAPLAGATRIGWPRFLLLNTLGSVLWVGTAIGAGALFHRSIAAFLERFEDLGGVALGIVVALIAAFVAFKWWERRRFYRAMRLARISVTELRKLIDEGEPPMIVDVRARSVRDLDGRYIPGALAIDLEELAGRGADFPRDREIVFYCECPNESSAAVAAKRLMELGFSRVRPLRGGLDEWIAAGYDIERRGARNGR